LPSSAGTPCANSVSSQCATATSRRYLALERVAEGGADDGAARDAGVAAGGCGQASTVSSDGKGIMSEILDFAYKLSKMVFADRK
jgi:hypothetical protein